MPDTAAGEARAALDVLLALLALAALAMLPVGILWLALAFGP